MKRTLLLGIGFFLVTAATPGLSVQAQDEPAVEQGDESGTRTLRRTNRMDFDARLVRGETAGTGAVVLFSRGNRRLPNLLERRRGFLRATVEEVMGTQARAGAVAASGSGGDEAERATEDSSRTNRRVRPNSRESTDRASRRGPARRAAEREQDTETPARRGGRSRRRR